MRKLFTSFTFFHRRHRFAAASGLKHPRGAEPQAKVSRGTTAKGGRARRAVGWPLSLVLWTAVTVFLIAPSRLAPASLPTSCARIVANGPEPEQATAPPAPGEFRPDPAAFAAVTERTGAKVLMATFATNFKHATPSQAGNIALVARKLTGVVIPAGAVFSYNRAAGPYTEANGYGWGRMFVGTRIVPTIGGGVCQGASTLYNVVLLANLPVVERHAHGLTVPYLPPGRDATVTDQGGLDFRFRNNTAGPLVLWGSAVHRWLTLALWGTVKPPKVRIETEVLATYPFETEVVADPSLPAGSEKVSAPGQPGARARTLVEVETSHGWVRHELPVDVYRASPRIVLHGSGPSK